MFPQTTIEIKISADDALLEQAEESSFTMLYCKYITSPKYTAGWWVNIWKTSYLVNSSTNESLALLNAINIPLAPEKHYLKKFGDSLDFVLVFPKIPAHWQVFNFIEKCNNEEGLAINGIVKNNTGIYRVQIY